MARPITKRTRDVLKAVKDSGNQGILAAEVATLNEDALNNVTATLVTLERVGCVRFIKEPQGKRRYFYVKSLEERDPPKRRKPAVKTTTTTKPAGLSDAELLKEANAYITELEAWKADAIRRYPELAVSQTTLAARKLVAETLRESGDHAHAELVMAGKKDSTPLMQVALKALEG